MPLNYLPSFVDRLPFWVLWPFGYTKVEPLALSSDCISVDENTLKLPFFVLERMKWYMSAHNAVHFLAVKPNPFPNSIGQVFTFSYWSVFVAYENMCV